MVRQVELNIEGMRSTVSDLVEEHHLPGIAVGLVSGEELVYSEGFGYADVESHRPQSPDLRQRIGSITKTMLALCAMRLVEEERLSLDDRVVDRLPDITFHGPVETLAVRHLMTHTGGIGEAPTMDDFRDPHQVLWSDTADVPPLSEAYAKGITIEVAPGSKWAYANHGFALLGEIVSRIECRPIEDVLRRRVFEPLGMANTDCLDQPHAELTTGYHRTPTLDDLDVMALAGTDPDDEQAVDGYNIRGRYRHVRPRAAGAVQSTIPDMARYASALLRKGRGIVSGSTFEMMLAPQVCPHQRLSRIGLTFFLRRRFGHTTFGHGGGVTGGWNTMLTVVPDRDLALLVHLNLSFDGMGQVESRILQAVLGAPDDPPHGGPIDPAILRSAPGVYQPAPGHLTSFRFVRGTGQVEVRAGDGGLILSARRGPWRHGAAMVLADAQDATLFAVGDSRPEPNMVALTLDDSGEVTGMQLDRLVTLFKTGA